MYGVIDWFDDPRTVCLRANVNEEFPCFISWRFGEERDQSTLTEEDTLRYLNGEFLSYWIDVQQEEVIDMYLSALEKQPSQYNNWNEADMVYIDEFDSDGYAYVTEEYEVLDPRPGEGIAFRCHECHEGANCGHEYSTPKEGKLVMQARMKELAHKHEIKITVGTGGADWFLEYLPYIHGEKPASEWPYEIPLERYRAAEPDYFIIEPDLGDPGTEQYEASLYTYSAAEPYANRVYAGTYR